MVNMDPEDVVSAEDGRAWDENDDRLREDVPPHHG